MNGPMNLKVRALDLSMGWAGPLVTQMLAEMGAEVIKVEGPGNNYDWWRGSLSVGPPELQPLERAATFNSVNRGKLGLVLDLTRARGVEILRRLAAVSDVLVENFTAGVMERLGLSYPALARLNPRLIMLSMPAFGSEGPEASARGYGMSIEAMAGVTGLCAYHDAERPYMLGNALGDPVSGLHGALAVLAALRERARTGRGQWVEIAQVETVIPFIAEHLIEYQLTGRVPRPVGNRHPRHAPHGIYRASGDANWIAIGVSSEEQWRELVRVLGVGHLAADERFADRARRKANEDALDREIGRALAGLDADDVAARLDEAGVPAGTINSAPAVLADRQLQSRDFFVPIERAVVGTHLYPAAVPRFARTPLSSDRPAPLIGEHSRKVMLEILGMSELELAEVERNGVVGANPVQSQETS
jgi:crotonobetainyl-CoA:carnitine CoA-transferase CaiB-like acyl-CoA transferase